MWVAEQQQVIVDTPGSRPAGKLAALQVDSPGYPLTHASEASIEKVC